MYSGDHNRAGAIGVYPEREEAKTGWFDRAGVYVGGLLAPWMGPRSDRFSWVVPRVNQLGPKVRGLGDDAIREAAKEVGQRMRREGYTDELVAESFALIREVAGRTLGTPHFDVQLIGGLALLNGMIAEMETGEGKTLTATLAAGTAALSGTSTHIVTVNDYLAARDAEWMGPIYKALGLSVGVIVHGKQPDARRAAYRSDVTYCTNKEVAFDYLRDRIILWDRPGQVRLQLERLFGGDSRVNKLVMQGLHFAIVDEADSVLIDEARTPLIISAEIGDGGEQGVYQEALDAARALVEGDDFKLSLSERIVELTEEGIARIEGDFPWVLGRTRTNAAQREELVRQALVAIFFFDRDKQYLVSEGKVQIIDEYTGRLMPDRSWERGLHQLIELKEGCEVTSRKETKARISYQRFFRRYLRLSGMTGTAREVSGELWSIYKLRVVSIPTNRALNRTYLPDKIFVSAQDKWDAVLKTTGKLHMVGRPVLVGTRSVAASDQLSALFTEAGLPHRVLNARQDKEEADIIAQAGTAGCITVATNMAGRGTDIRLEEGVAELGGLHVMATERHESGRIDRQLFGRCGRQGDPGSCEAYVSLEDELATVYLSRPVRGLAGLLLGRDKHVMGGLTGKVFFGKAQHSAERLHARMRHQLLKMDEQMGSALAFSGRQE
jgi:preprotein translocase subunit SecA